MVRASHTVERVISDLRTSTSVAGVTRQATTLILGLRPSYGWLAGTGHPSADVFDDSRVAGWSIGCAMLARRLARLPDAERRADPTLQRLTAWVDFEVAVDETRWSNIRPVAMLGASLFDDLADRNDDEAAAEFTAEVVASWGSTLEWCLARCDRGDMRVDERDAWLLTTWQERAEHVRNGMGVSRLLGWIGRHATTATAADEVAPLLTAEHVPIVQHLLDPVRCGA